MFIIEFKFIFNNYIFKAILLSYFYIGLFLHLKHIQQKCYSIFQHSLTINNRKVCAILDSVICEWIFLWFFFWCFFIIFCWNLSIGWNNGMTSNHNGEQKLNYENIFDKCVQRIKIPIINLCSIIVMCYNIIWIGSR